MPEYRPLLLSVRPVVTPTACPAGTHLDSPGGGRAEDCLACQPGTHSPEPGRSAPCPVCAADAYCPSYAQQTACPAHTVSHPGSASILQCRCGGGHVCAYRKEIHAVVTLLTTVDAFAADEGGVQTGFLAAVAAAAGVSAGQVTLHGVAAPASRRLLGLGGVDVHAVVSGAVRLHDLPGHLARRLPGLHVTHTVQHAHGVQAHPLLAHLANA